MSWSPTVFGEIVRAGTIALPWPLRHERSVSNARTASLEQPRTREQIGIVRFSRETGGDAVPDSIGFANLPDASDAEKYPREPETKQLQAK